MIAKITPNGSYCRRCEAYEQELREQKNIRIERELAIKQLVENGLVHDVNTVTDNGISTLIVDGVNICDHITRGSGHYVQNDPLMYHRMSLQLISELSKEVKQINDKLDKILDMIEFSPGDGPKYKEACADFELNAKNNAPVN